MVDVEKKFSEIFFAISVARSKLISSLVDLTLCQYFDTPYVIHVLLVFTTVTIVVSVFAVVRGLTLFSLHPVLMAVGGLLFLCEGLTCQRNRFLVETMGPIMQKSKRTKVRVIHVTMQTLAASFMSLGFIFIFSSKIMGGHSLLPLSLHSILGLVTMCCIAGQVLVGGQKIADMEVRPHATSRDYKWHGDAGLCLWDLVTLTICAGCLQFFGFGPLGVLVVGLVLFCWIAAHVQMKQKGPEGSELHTFLSTSAASSEPRRSESAGELLMEES